MPLNLTRSILVIIIPGGVAVAPWLILVVWTWPSVGELYGTYPLLVNVALFGAVVILGSVLEAFGALQEVRWDGALEGEYEVSENWFKYLSRVVDPEPVAHRYISRMVTSMYFELTMTCAISISALGAALLSFFSSSKFGVFFALGFLAVGALLTTFFQIQAKKSHKVLCDVRRELNQRLGRAV